MNSLGQVCSIMIIHVVYVYTEFLLAHNSLICGLADFYEYTIFLLIASV